MNGLEIFRPRTLNDLSVALESRPGAMIVAGGTDLVVKHRNGMLPALRCLVPIGHLGLDRIVCRDGVVSIGATCTMTQIVEQPGLAAAFPPLVQAAGQVGALQIRNMATIAGNLANASPAGDTIPALAVLDARLRIRRGDQVRVLPLLELFAGPGRTTLAPGEFIETVEFDDAPVLGAFVKLGERLAHAISKISVACAVRTDGGGRPQVRLALGAVGPKVLRCREAERILTEAPIPWSPEVIARAAVEAEKTTTPIDDVRSTRAYRSAMARTLTERLLGGIRLPPH